MKKIIVLMLLFCSMNQIIHAQFTTKKFGDGIKYTAPDTSFSFKMNFRMQALSESSWSLPADSSVDGDYSSKFLIRRSRLKFSGHAYSPKVKYKIELGLSNRDISSGNGSEFSGANNVVLDAFVDWNFYKGFVIRAGQSKLPGNRERLISSANLQLVDRSRLNSRFTLDRDVGFQLSNTHSLGGDFLLREIFSLAQGEGRNITDGHHGNYAYTYKIELLPFGKFASKGDYVGSAIKFESTPKLAFAVAYDTNINAVRERGQIGSFIKNSSGDYIGKTLNTFFVDLMFKYQKFSLMAEYADRTTSDDDPNVYDPQVDDLVLGTMYTGSGFNIQVGYFLGKKWEAAFRYTTISPDINVANSEVQYTFGLSKFITGHNLKVQTDFTYRSVEESDNQIIWRLQTEIQI